MAKAKAEVERRDLPVGGSVRFAWGDMSAPTDVPVPLDPDDGAIASHNYVWWGAYNILVTVRDATGKLVASRLALVVLLPSSAGHPHITSITPPTGDANSVTRTTVAVEGSGFAGATANLVRFGDQLGNGLNFYGDGSLVANTPLNQPPGPVPISLSYPGLGFVEATGAQFTYVTAAEEARRH